MLGINPGPGARRGLDRQRLSPIEQRQGLFGAAGSREPLGNAGCHHQPLQGSGLVVAIVRQVSLRIPQDIGGVRIEVWGIVCFVFSLAVWGTPCFGWVVEGHSGKGGTGASGASATHLTSPPRPAQMPSDHLYSKVFQALPDLVCLGHQPDGVIWPLHQPAAPKRCRL